MHCDCMSTDGVYTVSLYFRGQRNRADVLVGATVDRQWTDSGQRQTANNNNHSNPCCGTGPAVGVGYSGVTLPNYSFGLDIASPFQSMVLQLYVLRSRWAAMLQTLSDLISTCSLSLQACS